MLLLASSREVLGIMYVYICVLYFAWAGQRVQQCYICHKVSGVCCNIACMLYVATAICNGQSALIQL